MTPRTLVALLALAKLARADDLPPNRADNVYFTLPAGYRQSVGNDGTPFIKPEIEPGADWLQVRFPAPEPKPAGGARAVLDQRIAQLRAADGNLERLGPVAAQPGPTGESVIASVATKDPHGNRTLYVLCCADAGDMIQPVIVVTNSDRHWARQQPALLPVLGNLRFANTITLVPGDKPLTRLTIDRTADLLAWILDCPLTPQQRQTIEAHLVDAWRKADRDEIAGADKLLAARQQIVALSSSKQPLARHVVQADALKTWRASPAEFDRFLVATYDAAHPPLAPGEPRLTRAATDAVAEMLFFMASKVDGGLPVYAPDAVKAAFAQKMAASWPTLPDADRQRFADLPLTWAQLRAGWPEMSADQRQAATQQFAQNETVQQVVATLGQTREQERAALADRAYAGNRMLGDLYTRGNSTAAISNAMYSSYRSSMKITSITSKH